MVTSLLPGLASRASYVVPDPVVTRTGWRYADATDAEEIWNANIGDYIIDGPNIVIQRPGGVFRAIDMNPVFGNHNVPVSWPNKVIIKGGDYGYIKLETQYWNGNSDTEQVIITNYHGQINCGGFKTAIGFENTFGMAGSEYFRLTGKYDPTLKTGDPNYTGHETGYAYSAGRYGIRCSMNWTTQEQFNLAIGGTTAVGMANHFELDFIEVCDGGFGVSLKWDSPPALQNEAMTYKVHDCYFHDLGGEGGYYGQNTNNGSHRMINCEVYNNRYVRVANEGLQIGNYAEGCDVKNNVFVNCAMRWKSPFQPFQDRAEQNATRNGPMYFRNNLVIGCSEYFIVLSNANGINTPPDNPIPGNNIIVQNNLFFGTRYEGVYIFSINDGITGYDFLDNWFGYFMDSLLPANIKYSSVYPAKVGPVTRVVDNDCVDVPISFKRNKYPTGMTFVDGVTPNVTIGTGIDANTEVASPVLPVFVNPGFEPDYAYLNFSQWSSKIGEEAGFPFSGTNKGQNNVYNFGDWTMHKSAIYRSKIDNNFGHEPPAGTSDFYWELQLFNGGTRPPDDYRLDSIDGYNFLGIGLLDNEAPGTQEIPLDLELFNFVVFEPDVFDPVEIHIAATDAGNNKIRFNIDYPASILSDSPRIVGIGSSTMTGAGASPLSNGLPTLLSQWVTSNSNDGVFYAIALGGTYSNMFVPDGTTPQSDWNRNIDAALSLDPDIIIISLPSNDPSFNTNDQFLANLHTIFDRCQEANVYCFITTTQPRTEYSSALQQMLYDAAERINTDFKRFAIDVLTPLADPYSVQFPAKTKDIYNADSIHVNNAGHQVLRDTIVAALEAYFVDKNYTKYQIFRSTSPTTGFILLVDNITANEVFVDREDDQTYYYRVRAQRADTTFTAYSNVVSVDQDLFAGEVIQTTQINFGNAARPGPVDGWNTLLPSGDVPDAGEEFTNMLDTFGNNTGIGVRIIGSFNGVRSSGGRAGEFPLDVIRTSWRADVTNKAELEVFGLDPAFLYTFKFLSSAGSLSDYWYTGYVSGDRSAYVAANDPVLSTNDGETADLIGLQPEGDGTLRFKIKALPAATIAFVNALQIYKLNQNNALPIDLEVFDPAMLEPIVLLGGTTNGVVQVNLTGDVDSALDDWNDINADVTTTFQDLFTEAGVNTSIGIKFTNIQTPKTDNGSSYLGNTEWPTAVIRYGIYRSGNPPMVTTFVNIKETKTLDFRFLASRDDTDNVQSITIGSVTQEVNVNDNLDRELIFLNVAPDVNGEIPVTVTWISGPSTGFTYLTALKFEVKDADANVPIILDLEVFDPVFFEPEVLQQDVIIDLATFDPVFFEPVVGEAGGSAAVLSTNQTYVGTERAMIYQPAGYNSNSNSYPLIIYLHGAGKTISTILSEGIPLMLNSGDTLDAEFLVIAPGGPSGLDSWGQIINGQMRPKHAYDYMVANYRVDINRVYVTGLSLGAAGSMLMGKDYAILLAGILAFAGSQAMDFPWANLINIPVWSQHGSTDTTQDRTNTGRVGRGMNALPSKYPPLMSIYWGVGHSSAVWHDNGYRRKDSPVAGTKAKYNYNKWFLKYSKNAEQEAFGHVSYAEGTLLIEDYLQAVPVVNALPSSAFKTGLLGQLSNLRASLFSKMFVVDLGSSTYPSAAPINNITNINNSISIPNITDYDGVASSVGLTIINRFSTFAPQTEFPTIATYGKYYSLDRNLSRDGARLLTSITNGSMKFTGLNAAKQYKVVVLHSMDNNDDFATQATLSVTIGAVTQTQYSQLNTFYTLVFDNITPVSNEILIAAKCASTRDTCITGLILIEKP
jgi:lysophospholipase L1-like esterase